MTQDVTPKNLPNTHAKSHPEFDIKSFLKQLSERPGVYRMLNANDDILYVGKAKNLKRRVSSYFLKSQKEMKTEAMVSQVARIEVTITETEAEALILENTLIKRHKPKYNILFRDDKSYPYIYVSTDKTFPSLSFYRGAKRKKGEYFGPFPNGNAVHQTLDTLQKIFPVRQCPESVFRHRSRPCLQYQIKRCSGPCIEGLVSKEEYASDVRYTLMFLAGKSFEVIEEMGVKMESAAAELEFEQAGIYRDRIAALRTIQNQHLINQPGDKDMDVLAVVEQTGQIALCLMMYRGGNLWGSEVFYPKVPADLPAGEVLAAFISQHYQLHPVPRIIVLEEEIPEKTILQQALSEQHQNPVAIRQANTPSLKGLVQLALTNATAALKQHLTQKASQFERVEVLQEVLGLAKPPMHMECFDISHTQGEQTIASCVVFKEGVPSTKHYRKFNIEGITGGDDYAAMHQVLTRRYSRLKNENAGFPDLIIVDGGKGQLTQAIDVLKSLELEHLSLVSVAKGEGRKAGLEVLYTPFDKEGIDLQPDDRALHLINHIRDEAHRFAITSHRKKRQSNFSHSRLEDIEGIGPKTRKKLLMHFGGLAEVKNAAVSELQKVQGISLAKAQQIYDFFHGDI